MDIKLVRYFNKRPHILKYVKNHYKGQSYIRRVYGIISRCQKCNKKFFTILKPKQAKRPMKFCSKRCIQHPKGHIAIGKIIQRKSGYFQIMMPNHPHADSQGRIMLHRFMIEKKIGRYLHTWEVVHHIDRDKSNNDLKNLRIMSAYDHSLLHLKEKWTKTTSWSKNKDEKDWTDEKILLYGKTHKV